MLSSKSAKEDGLFASYTVHVLRDFHDGVFLHILTAVLQAHRSSSTMLTHHHTTRCGVFLLAHRGALATSLIYVITNDARHLELPCADTDSLPSSKFHKICNKHTAVPNGCGGCIYVQNNSTMINSRRGRCRNEG